VEGKEEMEVFETEKRLDGAGSGTMTIWYQQHEWDRPSSLDCNMRGPSLIVGVDHGGRKIFVSGRGPTLVSS